MSVDERHQITTGQVFIGVFGTLSFFMVNTVKNSHVSCIIWNYHNFEYAKLPCLRHNFKKEDCMTVTNIFKNPDVNLNYKIHSLDIRR